MPANDDVLMLAQQAKRLGVLWRSRGQAFLDHEAAELQDDVERLRASYLAGLGSDRPEGRPKRGRRAPPVIDLREPEALEGLVCSTDGHAFESAAGRCSRCSGPFCTSCIVQNEATRGRPLCLACALVAGGVHHRKVRPLVAPGRQSRG
ncbi:MAG: hypothetical protein JO265_01525 [Acidimicrobiia bacterium]|nr:hypothetical protein [Acidimicrobiia bacterium]